MRASNGTFTTFDAPGGASIYPLIYSPGGPPPSITPAGAIAGTFIEPNFYEHGFLRTRGGIFTTFDPPGSLDTEVLDMNPAGAFVGDYCDAVACYGFLRTPDGTISTFDPPGSTYTAPLAINPAGAVAGWFLSSGFHGFLRTPDGTITTFDVPGSFGSNRGMTCLEMPGVILPARKAQALAPLD